MLISIICWFLLGFKRSSFFPHHISQFRTFFFVADCSLITDFKCTSRASQWINPLNMHLWWEESIRFKTEQLNQNTLWKVLHFIYKLQKQKRKPNCITFSSLDSSSVSYPGQINILTSSTSSGEYVPYSPLNIYCLLNFVILCNQ